MNLHKEKELRVIIISPNFPPTNGADMHRVRMVVPYLYQFGWVPVIVAAMPEAIHTPQDPWLATTVPPQIPVHRASTLGLNWAKIPGLGGVDLRARSGIRRQVNQLLRSAEYDLIYFSTTCFGVHVLGPYWKRKFGIPFVMDYQDPWVNDYYRQHPKVVPPGGRFKYSIVDFLSRFREPRVLKQCSGITAVSPTYPRQLKDRYPWLGELPARVLPFPGAARDFERIREEPVAQSVFSRSDGMRHWVYVGRGGPDMAFALSGFFSALRCWREQHPHEFAKTRIHFIGTSYAPSGKGSQTVIPLAEECGVSNIVVESPDRIPYCQMLSCLTDADGLIVPGSDDAAYTASKIYPYLLAEKPLLAVFNRNSSVADVISRVGGARLVTFDETTRPDQLTSAVYQSWFEGERFQRRERLDSIAFEQYTDSGCARQLCEFFDAILQVAK